MDIRKVIADDAKKKIDGVDALCSLVLIAPNFFLSAWSLQLMWNWFAPAVWSEVPRLTFKQAAAAFLLRCWFRLGELDEKPKEYEPMRQTNRAIKQAGSVLFILAISWIVHKVFFS